MAKNRYWTSAEEQAMVLAYTNGENLVSIAKRYETSHQTVATVLRNRGVALRSMREINKRQTCDEHYFQVIDTEEKAYWLGFLTADGCITKGKKPGDSPRLSIHLGKQDYGHLVKLKQALQASQMISTNERSCSLAIFSSEMVADLAMHGILPRKTFSTKPTQVAPELARHYWRGVIDGDGHISKDRDTLVLVGDYEVILGFQAFVLAHCPKVKACITRMENIYKFAVTGKASVVMLHLLYGEAAVYLDRKYELARLRFP